MENPQFSVLLPRREDADAEETAVDSAAVDVAGTVDAAEDSVAEGVAAAETVEVSAVVKWPGKMPLFNPFFVPVLYLPLFCVFQFFKLTDLFLFNINAVSVF